MVTDKMGIYYFLILSEAKIPVPAENSVPVIAGYSRVLNI